MTSCPLYEAAIQRNREAAKDAEIARLRAEEAQARRDAAELREDLQEARSELAALRGRIEGSAVAIIRDQLGARGYVRAYLPRNATVEPPIDERVRLVMEDGAG